MTKRTKKKTTAPRKRRARATTPTEPKAAPPPLDDEPTDVDAMLAMIDEISASVPREVWDTLPRDGAANVDHYVYGSRKKTRGTPEKH